MHFFPKFCMILFFPVPNRRHHAAPLLERELLLGRRGGRTQRARHLLAHLHVLLLELPSGHTGKKIVYLTIYDSALFY